MKNHLLITDRRKAKELSASILEYEQKLVYADAMLTHEAVLPKYLSITDEVEKADIIIDYHRLSGNMKGLQLIPEKTVWIGIGCRKGTETDKIKAAIRYFLTEHAIDERSVAGIASIDVKAQEQGILDACREYNWPFITFSAEKLCALEGDFTASEFVKVMLVWIMSVSGLHFVRPGRMKKTASSDMERPYFLSERKLCLGLHWLRPVQAGG